MTGTSGRDGDLARRCCECASRYPWLTLLKRALKVVALALSIWTALKPL